jgi:hypothetical protein
MIRKNIVVSGCSYTENSSWPGLIWPDSRIINLARSAAGNNYIADSIMYKRDPAHSHIFAVDPRNPPDFVYVLFSGVHRSDLAVPICPEMEKFASHYKFCQHGDDTIYMFSGGHQGKYNPRFIGHYDSIREPSWPDVQKFSDWMNLPEEIKQRCLEANIFEREAWSVDQMIQSAWNLRYWPNDTFLQTETYKAVIRCLDFLTLHKIKYAFSFFYDVFNPEYETVNSYGCLSRDHPLYHRIDWSKLIKPFPFDLALRHDHILEDGCHQSQDGERLYAATIKDQLRSFL